VANHGNMRERCSAQITLKQQSYLAIYVITSKERKRNVTLTLLHESFACMSTPKSIEFGNDDVHNSRLLIIHGMMRLFPIRSNGQELCVELEVPTTGPRTLAARFPQNECLYVMRLWCGRAKMTLRAALHLEAGPIRCVRGFKSSLVIGQKAQIGPNPFTPRGRANLVV
jgi:hypothetical protein